jgi:hypothetical protein
MNRWINGIGVILFLAGIFSHMDARTGVECEKKQAPNDWM